MSSKSSASSGLRQAFDKYSKFGKTHAQLADHNELRIGSAGIQKMMKDCSLIDTKYTSQLLDNDIARVLGKITTGTPEAGTVHYPKGTYVGDTWDSSDRIMLISLSLSARKTFEIKGFKLLIDRIAESKTVTHDDILAKINANEGPSLTHVTETANKDITDRMTDTSHYT